MAASNLPTPDFDDFERYYSGQMPSVEQRLLEGRMLDEPLLAEAYEGFLAWRTQHPDVAGLRSNLRDRLHTRVRDVRKDGLPLWAYASAASVLLVMFAYWMLFIRGERIEMEKSSAVANQKETTLPAPDHGTSATRIQSTQTPESPVLPLASKQTTPGPSPEVIAKSDVTQPVEMADEAIKERETSVALADPVQVEALPAQVAPQPAKALAAPASAVAVGKSMAARAKAAPSSPHFVSGKAVAMNSSAVKDSGAPDQAVLSEKRPNVVVPAEMNAARPVPADGWESYNAYLDRNTDSSSTTGDVVVTFVVSPTGTLSAFATKGIKELQDQAIRIIKEGPTWLPVKVNGVVVEATVEIKLQFRKSQ